MVKDSAGSKIRALPTPMPPSQEEYDRHQIDHCEYQAWCRACVAGRGKADAHHGLDDEFPGVAKVSCDYCFMGKVVEDEQMCQDCLPILVHFSMIGFVGASVFI